MVTNSTHDICAHWHQSPDYSTLQSLCECLFPYSNPNVYLHHRKPPLEGENSAKHTYKHTHTHTHMYTHKYTHMKTHTDTHTHKHTHMYTHTHTHTHHTHTQTHTHTHTHNHILVVDPRQCWLRNQLVKSVYTVLSDKSVERVMQQ